MTTGAIHPLRRPALTWPEHIRAVLSLGLPLVGTNIAGFLLHMTDTLMLGWYDVTALAAATLATSFWFIVFILGAGIANAVMPLVAAADAEGDDIRVRRVTRMGLWLSLAYALVVLPPLYWSEAIFLAIGQEPQIAALAEEYLRIAAFGMIPGLIFAAFRSFLSALERTGFLLVITLVALVLNACINYALIFGNWGAPEMGIRGAAVASVAVQSGWVLVCGLYIARALPQYRLFQRWWKSDGTILREVFVLGVPIGLTALAEGGLFAASAVLMGLLGEIELAAHGIAIQIAGAAFMWHLGMSQAATVRAGNALGRRDEPGLRRGAWAAIALSGGFAVLAVVAFLAVPEPMASAFLDPDDPDREAVLAVAVVLMAMAALFQFVDAAQAMALGLLRGVQDTRVPFYIAVLSYWGLGITSSYVFGFHTPLGAMGIWLGLVVGLSFAAVLLMVRFWRRGAVLS